MPETTFLDANELVINMGPQHPATHGVLRVKLKLDGEKLTGLHAKAHVIDDNQFLKRAADLFETYSDT